MVKPISLAKKQKAAAAENAADGPETGARILQAARREFVAKGLDGARMQAIAAGAGVNKALLHYYYRSKDKLYQAALQDILTSVWGRLEAESRAPGPGEGLEPRVRALVSTFVRTLAANPDFPLFIFREIAGGALAIQTLLREGAATVVGVLAPLLAALRSEIKAGRAQPIKPLHFIMNLMGMCVATFLARPFLERVGPELGIKVDYGEKFLRERIDAITDMVFYGLRTRR